MFGFIMANLQELTEQQKTQYQAVYCGVCRQIRQFASQTARFALRYDMAFLALLLMSLYEPQNDGGVRACILHRKRVWLDNEYVRYAAQMNVVLAYYKALDDYCDDGNVAAYAMARVFAKPVHEIQARFPRQCQAIKLCIAALSQMEKEKCENPDTPAGCFGELMAELLVYEEDLWSPTLRQMGIALGRYIYLADAAVDYRRDKRGKKYNPYLLMGTGENWQLWEKYLVLAMSRCTDAYERLPLVQDKGLLDNILYSGIWVEYRRRQHLAQRGREEKI